MKPNDWAAIIFGIVAMVFSFLAKRRALAADARAERAEAKTVPNSDPNSTQKEKS